MALGTVTAEIERAERVVDSIEDLERVEEELSDAVEGDDRPEGLEAIQRVRDELIDLTLPEMRISTAAALLELSPPTVNKWADLGLLEELEDISPRRVTTRSVLELRPHVLRLRELGRNRHLLQAVLARVADDDLLHDPAIEESLRASDAGDVREVTDAELDALSQRTRVARARATSPRTAKAAKATSGRRAKTTSRRR